MTIGIPKEIMTGEARVAASPETVKKFIEDGEKVLVEKGAGINSLYHDEEYVAMGAEIVSDPIELYKKSNLILKVKEPLFNAALNMHEVDMMHKGQYLITFIHPASPVNHDMVKKLANAGITSLTLDGIPRISRAQNMDALTSMSTCAGYKGIL
ncbi:MAG: NAD(P)(+) transhydrogenase (Re/Si-specific) subunit alpha, partial [Dysgonamonadaceae bacterium]|nr:NAD(P)(+) transhydrogenase (Re/Si-specific) subunit alpha [Dysgonamonadaceae bacterium]